MIVSSFQSTPPRGRRQTEKVTGTTTEISIHASAREATSRWRQIEEILNISIHASAREATTDPTGYPTNLGGFQSTPPRGRRLTAKNFTVDAADFNPRLREGGDKYPFVLDVLYAEFQSTPPRGRRRSKRSSSPRSCRFQSTPPRGRRPTVTHGSFFVTEFQSTPPRGRRPVAM